MHIRYCLSAFAIAFVLMSPLANADDGSVTPNVQTQSNNKSLSNSPSKVIRLPLAAASFVAGAIIGTPIAMVRHSADEVGHATKGMSRGLQKPPFTPFFVIVGPTAVVLGGLGGALEGPFYAVENSGANCVNKPFGKESFSLGPIKKWEAAD